VSDPAFSTVAVENMTATEVTTELEKLVQLYARTGSMPPVLAMRVMRRAIALMDIAYSGAGEDI